MSNLQIKKLTLAGLLVALATALSAFSIPIGAARCFPVQHMVNVLAGVLLGPGYAVGMAFVTSLLRVMLGTGSLLAFPGSMLGALCCGLLYRFSGRIAPACFGELFGTGVLGALAAYPVATLLMGKQAALFTYLLPFCVSTLGGATMAALLLGALQKTGMLGRVRTTLAHRQTEGSIRHV